MKLNCKPVFWGIFAALLLASTCSEALTLGRVRGAALLGRPLDVAVLVQYSAEEEVGSNCFEAEVHYGDTAVESSRVQVSVQAGTQANSQLVKVSSSATVDEAVVRLTLKAKCASPASRQYVLLADLVSELAGAGVNVRATAPSDTSVRRSDSQAAIGTLAQPPVAAVKAPRAAEAPPVSKPKPLSAPKISAPSTKSDTSVGSGSGGKVRVPALEELERRVDEIAKLQATNSNADDVLKSEARATALEAEIRGLKLVTAKNQQSIQLVAAALESNSSQAVSRPLVYGLGGLLLLLIAALAYVGQRMQAGGYVAAPWWSATSERSTEQGTVMRRTKPAPLDKLETLPATARNSPRENEEVAFTGGPSTLDPHTADDQDKGVQFKDTAVATAAALLVQQKGALDRANRCDSIPSGAGTIRAINTGEMLDVRQQAEFFMALGQHDEAVRLLESNIRGSTDCNPLVFLDLLKIFHTLSRRAEFERYREEFNAQFTGRIPPYASFTSEGNGLDAYEEICNQIVVLWPTDYTIDYIEQCLVRLPEDAPEQGIDLEAFKDLLMLYGVLKRLDQGNNSEHAPFSASRVELPQNMVPPGSPTTAEPVTATQNSGATAPMDIDLDLDISAAAPSVPVIDHNLIDFDMSEYIAQKKADASK